MALITVILLFLATVACTGNEKSTGTTLAARGSVRELPLPSVPSILTSPEERADYVLLHFWDSLDCRRDGRDTALIEQSFSNFISVFPYASGDDARVAAVSSLMKKAEPYRDTYGTVAYIAHLYLGDPNSPMRNEDLHILFLNEIVTSSAPSAYEKVRSAHLLEAAMKNRPGTVAADISYDSRGGEHGTLYGLSGPEAVLLVFYDPDCENCSAIIGKMMRSEILEEFVREGVLKVLAVYPEGNRELWDRTKDNLPSWWTVGFDTGGVNDTRTYELPAMPVLYLLDSAKRVVLKDAPFEYIMEYLVRL